MEKTRDYVLSILQDNKWIWEEIDRGRSDEEVLDTMRQVADETPDFGDQAFEVGIATLLKIARQIQ